MCPRGVCMYVSGKCMYPPPPPYPTKTNNLDFPKNIFLAQKVFFTQMVTWGKACSSPFLSHFVSGCLNDCALSNRWFVWHGVQVVGARSATYVRARPKFLLKGNSSVSAQHLQNFGPARHRFLIPYALHSFLWFGCLLE